MIYLHERAESTNDLALEAASDDAPHGACWVADTQTSGRGSREIGGERNEWFSPPASNIYMSVLLRPEMTPAEATHMTLAAAVGAVDAIADETEVDVWIKWPNDLFVRDRKLAGILTEAQTSGGALEGVVVGLGVNVNLAPDDVPDDVDEEVTSLQVETGHRWDRLSLMFGIRDGVVDRCEAYAESGLDAVIDEVRELDRTAGREVRVRRREGDRHGVARGVDEAGHLRVDVDGETLEVQAGEVDFL